MNWSVNGTFFEAAPINAVSSILVGSGSNRINAGVLLLNYSTIVMLMFPITKKMTEIMQLDSIILARTVKRSLLSIHTTFVAKTMMFVIAAKITSDVFTDKVLVTLDAVRQYCIISFSMLLSIAIWFLISHLLLLHRINDKFVFMGVVLALAISQIQSDSIPILNLILIFSNGIQHNVPIWLSMKIGLLVLMIFFNIAKLSRYEVY
jgi:hypothetical protein